MMEELSFAVKCGGSAKKIQLSTTTAVPVKSPSKLGTEDSSLFDKNLSKSTVNLGKKECKKCEEIIENERLDNITSNNAIVCKHDSKSNLSIRNPGLLIVEQDATVDAQTTLLNANVVPHSHLNLSHEQAKQIYMDNAIMKSKKPKNRKKNVSRYNMEDDSNEFIQMQTFSIRNQEVTTSDTSNFGKARKSTQMKQNISKSKDLYEIPIIRYNPNQNGDLNQMSQMAQNQRQNINRDKISTNLSSSSNYQTGNYNFR